MLNPSPNPIQQKKVAHNRYKANYNDKLRLLEHAKPLLSGKPLMLRVSQELDDTIFESSGSDYQITSLEFLCEYLECTQNYIC